MSEATKAIVRRSIEHFNDPENRTAYFELYHPDAVLHGYQGVEPGLEGIKRFYDAFWEAFPDGRLTIDDRQMGQSGVSLHVCPLPPAKR